ncbi:60S ribosomal protein L22 [Geranomyces variabilis]|uniref:Large ribosomal subunit protein eL22 n=1 Tax=Geranomyces variabilis TaxID=109894 RepID=A0AAD5XRS5_9FUNG|nr:ribosomal protein L22e [Geranomyces variabilis]KAJ3142141.1 60S ribosomal protein L22 [Geranomyces variabilis]KAJ3156405.1 60S ribosomal protein L22 [Geranomyces variabilis]KAJ3165624.1 60S ribosomal protein L22 [Geranomyces variabilis]KAJ3180723.1 60S ribosomal protein L22 [Geranomyces variabilis]
MAITKKDNKAAKKAPVKFTIDCSSPANDGIFDIDSFEKFLHDRVKVGGRTGNLADAVAIAKGASGSLTITVQPNTQFPKRYIKYLTKKFLKKHQLRDWIRVISSSKNAYELRYFNIADADNDAEDDE